MTTIYDRHSFGRPPKSPLRGLWIIAVIVIVFLCFWVTRTYGGPTSHPSVHGGGRYLPSTRPVIVNAVEPPRWPAGTFLIFDTFDKTNVAREDGGEWYYPGTVPMRTEGGQTPPFMYVGGWTGPRNVLSPENVREVARRAAADGAHVVAIDAEDWPRDIRRHLDADIEKSSNYYKRVFDLWREADPQVLIGAYFHINREYWVPLSFRDGMIALEAIGRGETVKDGAWRAGQIYSRDAGGKWFLDRNKKVVIEYERWKESNERWQWGLNTRKNRNDQYGMADAADIVFIDCYLMYNRAKDSKVGETEDADISADRIYLQENIREAHRVSGGKPVVVFLTPHLIYTNGGSSVQMSDRRWLEAARVVKEEKAAGIAFWGYGGFWEYEENKLRLLVQEVAIPGPKGPSTRPIGRGRIAG